MKWKAFVLLLVLIPAARADDADEIRALRDEIHRLEARLDALEQKRAAPSADAAPAAPTGGAPAVAATPGAPAPRVKVDDSGFSLTSADGSDYLKLRGLVEADSHWYFDDHGIGNNNTFLVRRARLIMDGGFDKIYSFLLVPEFGGGAAGTSNTPVIYDAAVRITPSPEFGLTFGKFKAPLGLEMLQDESYLITPERSLATDLVPVRDVGAQASGKLLGGVFNYALAVTNGNPDGAYANNVDTDNNKDFDGRIFVQLGGLGVGISGDRGIEGRGSTLTSGYRTDSLQTFFTYRGSVVEDGASWRVSPQTNYYRGPLGLQAEYTVSAVNLLAGTAAAELRNHAWQLGGEYVLTGENASYSGIQPKAPFRPDRGTWGAVELAARIDGLRVDSKAFPLFADPNASARGATSFQLGVNWWLARTVKATVDVLDTHFDLAPGSTMPTTPLLQGDEKALLTRVLVGF